MAGRRVRRFACYPEGIYHRRLGLRKPTESLQQFQSSSSTCSTMPASLPRPLDTRDTTSSTLSRINYQPQPIPHPHTFCPIPTVSYANSQQSRKSGTETRKTATVHAPCDLVANNSRIEIIVKCIIQLLPLTNCRTDTPIAWDFDVDTIYIGKGENSTDLLVELGADLP